MVLLTIWEEIALELLLQTTSTFVEGWFLHKNLLLPHAHLYSLQVPEAFSISMVWRNK